MDLDKFVLWLNFGRRDGVDSCQDRLPLASLRHLLRIAAKERWRLRGSPQRHIENLFRFGFLARDIQGGDQVGYNVVISSNVIAGLQLSPRSLEQIERLIETRLRFLWNSV